MTDITENFICSKCNKIIKNGQICFYVKRKIFCSKCYIQDVKEQLKQQLEEQDKEIERLNTIKNNAIECADLFKVALSVRQKDLAIQELEKVKEEMDLNGNSYCEIRQGTSPHNPTDYAWFNYVKFRNYLNQQIKELKGEKDVKD